MASAAVNGQRRGMSKAAVSVIGAGPAGLIAAERLARAYEYFQARQRQLAAVLEAHGIPVTFAYCSDATDVRETLVG